MKNVTFPSIQLPAFQIGDRVAHLDTEINTEGLPHSFYVGIISEIKLDATGQWHYFVDSTGDELSAYRDPQAYDNPWFTASQLQKVTHNLSKEIILVNQEAESRVIHRMAVAC